MKAATPKRKEPGTVGKLCIIGLQSLHLMQFLYKYTDILDEANIAYDVIHWERSPDSPAKHRPFGGQKITFSHAMSDYQPRRKKAWSYLKCLAFVRATLRKNPYDKAILLTTQTALPLCLISARTRRRGRYIYDYRDITFEAHPLCKRLILRIIQNSAFTAISSLGFKALLGESEKLLMAHNASRLSRSPAIKRPAGRIRLAYWGILRQIEYNKRLCDLFGNDPRFELVYHGEGHVEALQTYCEEKGYDRIRFTGRYTAEQIPAFAARTDILLNCYDNDRIQTLATTVKLYDGIRYGIPMLISPHSHMAALMAGNPAVFLLDAVQTTADDVADWYAGLDGLPYPYEAALAQVQQDDARFRERLLAFAGQ